MSGRSYSLLIAAFFFLLVILPTYLSWGTGTWISVMGKQIHHHNAAFTPALFSLVLLILYLASSRFRKATLELISTYDSLSLPTHRIIGFTVFFLAAAWMALLKYFQASLLFTHIYDHGIYVNILYNIAHGNGFLNSFEHRNYLTDHFSPFLAVLSPPFILYDAFGWPLIAQTLAFIAFVYIVVERIGTSVYPLRAFERLLIISVLLLSRYTQNVHRFDVHAIAFSMPVVATVYYVCCIRTLRHWLWILLPVAFFTIQEDVPLMVAGFGFYLTLQSKTRRLGVLISLLSIFAFMANFKVIIPLIADRQSSYVTRYASLGPSFGAIAVGLLTSPWRLLKLIYPPRLSFLLRLFGSFGFLPFYTVACITLLPSLLQHGLSDYPGQYSFSFHYSANVLPAIALTLVIVFSSARIAYSRLLPICLILIIYNCADSPQYLRPRSPELPKATHQLAETLGPDVKVSVQDSIGVPFSARPNVYLFPEVNDASIVVLAPKMTTWPLSKTEYEEKVQGLRQSGKWKEEHRDELLVFLSKSDETPSGLFSKKLQFSQGM